MIEAVILDWAGTTVDFGSMAPVEAFRESFAQYGIEVSNEEIRKPMGMLKIDHIRTMLNMPRIYDVFCEVYGRAFEEADVQAIYASFHGHLMQAISAHTKVKPYVLDAIKELRDMGVRIGSTTGYTDEMMTVVVEAAKRQGYAPDFWISPDGVGGSGRPKPYMIFANMQVLGIDHVHKVMKIGDTLSDIAEGKHAGVYTVGVLEGSSLVGVSETEYKELSDEKRCALLETAREAYFAHGADTVIMNFKELPTLVKHLSK